MPLGTHPVKAGPSLRCGGSGILLQCWRLDLVSHGVEGLPVYRRKMASGSLGFEWAWHEWGPADTRVARNKARRLGYPTRSGSDVVRLSTVGPPLGFCPSLEYSLDPSIE